MDTKKYLNCWVCDNIVSRAGAVALYHSVFPRVFVETTNDVLYLADYDTWRAKTVVSWIDEADSEIKEAVLEMLWDFSVLQEEEEENYSNNEDWDI